jgi:hypothetical protein
VHAYGVVDGEFTAKANVSGLGGAPVISREVGSLRVLLSALDPEQYGEGVWREHGQDPTWLRDVARDHHSVLQTFADRTDVVPFRLPSLHLGESGLLRTTKARLEELARALLHIRGQCEWGLKIYRRPDPSPVAPPKNKRATGRDYLLSRSRSSAEREGSKREREAAVREVHRAFTCHATETVLSALQDRSLSGRAEPMVLNASYLVKRSEQKRIQALTRDWGTRVRPLGLALELTGPWPPYHFASAPKMGGQDVGTERS